MIFRYQHTVLFILTFIMLVILIKWGAVLLFIFPLMHQFKHLHKYAGLILGGLSAGLTIGIWTFKQESVPFELVLVSSLIYISVGLVVSHNRANIDHSPEDVKRLKDKVKQLQSQLQTIKFALPDRAFIFDKDGYYVDVLSQLIAPEVRDSLIGKHVSHPPRTVTPETTKQIIATIHKTLATGQSQRLEYQAFTSKDRMWCWLEGRTALIKSAQSGRALVMWVARDITEQKQLQDNLEMVQHLAQIGTWSTDVKSNYVTWSREMYRIYGIQPEDFDHTIGDVTRRIHPDDLEGFQTRINHDEDPYPTEYRIIRPDGAIRNVFAVGDTVYDEDRQAVQRIGLLQDITDRKQAEQERSQLQIEQQRISTLRNLITNVTHDIMTPLTAIKTKLYLIDNIPDETRRKEHLELVGEQVNILEGLFNNLLTVSYLNNIELNQLTRNISNIVEILKNLSVQYQSMMSEKNQTLITDIPDTSILLSMDVHYMWRAIAGLLQNAGQYTPEGGEIRLILAEDDTQVHITIADNGVGIHPDDLNSIFDQFYRVAEHRPANGSSGLGLSITKLVIELHGGQITVDSTPDVGSTFCITLPKM